MDSVIFPAWYVYILRCGDGSLYTGITREMERRWEQHNSGKGARYTRSRLPVQVVYWEIQPDKSTALKREWAIKHLSKARKEDLVKGSYPGLPLSARCESRQ